MTISGSHKPVRANAKPAKEGYVTWLVDGWMASYRMQPQYGARR